NLFNDTPYYIELKHKGFKPFLAKYIFLTARKPPEDAYNFGRTQNYEESI
ncbi:13175_t:CDS:1, partial [Racocetra persica]